MQRCSHICYITTKTEHFEYFKGAQKRAHTQAIRENLIALVNAL
jgi:hypothetical protein